MKLQDVVEAECVVDDMLNTAVKLGLMPMALICGPCCCTDPNQYAVLTHPDLRMEPDAVRKWFAAMAEAVIRQGTVAPPAPDMNPR